MGIWGKYERHINIIAKFFIIIILLFICYRIVIYDAQINELTRAIANIESSGISFAEGMPVHMSQSYPEYIREEHLGIMVNITGAVIEPGVYVLDESARLIDLVELAGGAHERADMERVNLAAHLQDASHIRIPFVDDEGDFELLSVVEDAGAGAMNSMGGASDAGLGLVNINTAGRSDLESLPGIGPVIAGNIIGFRELNGPFTHLEDLKSVNGIGPAVFGSIRDFIEL